MTTPPLRATTSDAAPTPRTTRPRARKTVSHDVETPPVGGNPGTASESGRTAHSGSRKWTLNIPAPAAFMSLNDRRHWAHRAKLTRLWRSAAHVYARQAKLPKGLPAAHTEVRVVKATGRAYDVHNLVPTAKACIDGLVDYGLLADDSNEFLTGPDLRPGGIGLPGLVMVITEIPCVTSRIQS